MNRIVNKILGGKSLTPKPKAEPRKKRIAICRQGEVIAVVDYRDDYLKLFDGYSDCDVLNIVYKNGKTKVIVKP